MTRSRRSIAGFVLIALGWSLGCGAEATDPVTAPVSSILRPDAPAAAKQSARKDHAPREVHVPRDEPRSTRTAPGTPSDARVGVDRERLFARLPKQTLLALRMPAVERLGEGFQRSFLAELLEDPQYEAQREQMALGLRHLESELRHQFTDYDELRARVESVRGELVLAVTSFDATALQWTHRIPGSVAALFDAVGDGENVNELLERLVQKHEKEERITIPCVREGEDRWHRTLVFGDTALDLVRQGDLFLLEVSPGRASRSAAQILPERAREESFCGSRLFRDAPDMARDGATVVCELYVHAAPIWDLVRMFAPPEARTVIQAGGFDAIEGVSIASALAEVGSTQVVTLHSEGGRDLLSRAVGKGALSAELAERIPADHDHAGLVALDLDALFTGITAIVPARERGEIEADLARLHAELGVDLRADVFENLGPTFAWSAKGDLLHAKNRAIEFLFAVELQDAARMEKLLDAALSHVDPGGELATQVIEGATFQRIALPPIPLPDGSTIALEPTFGVHGGAFVCASTPDVLAKSLACARARPESRQRALLDAIDPLGDDAWMLSVSPATRLSPAGIAIGSRTPHGLTVETRGGGVRTGGGMLATIPVVASIAIPNLMEARLAANEAAAVSTLRGVCKAEAVFRSAAEVDSDRDGRGEFGHLEELCGAAALRGREDRLDTPLLDPHGWREFQRGMAARSGYVYRLDLRSTSGKPNCEAASANKVAADDAELRFVAYAWPLDYRRTGVRAFAIDPRGVVYATQNDGKDQGYSGFEHPPRASAWCADEASVLRQFKSDVHLGGDGGTWRRVE